MKDLKEKLKEIIKNIKIIQPKTKRYDSIREELEKFGYFDLKECIWNILNNFPDHICKYCGKETKFRSIQKGYKIFCNSACANKFKGSDKSINEKISKTLKYTYSNFDNNYWNKRTENHRNTLQNRTDEYKLRKKEEKSERMKRVHLNRSEEEKSTINKNISIAVKNSKKAIKQRHERAILGAKALNEYRKTLSKEKLKEFNKKFGSKDVIKDLRSEFREYYKLVWYFTNLNLKLVENIEIRSVKFHLDHKYSVKQGFLDKIDPEIIGSIYNLEIISASKNCSKQDRCSISKDSLLKLFNS